MSPNTTPMCTSSSNVFSWKKISQDDWTKSAEGECLPLQFVTVAPTDGKIIKWNLEVYPKGSTDPQIQNSEGTKYLSVLLGVDIEFALDTEHDIGQFQIETAYRIRHGHCPLDMSNSISFHSFHSDVFKENPNQWLGESYEDGPVEDLAVDGFITFEFEIRTYSAPWMKFQFSGSKQEYVNNFKTVDPENGDVKLICDDKEFLCHKFLLISQSPVFRAMFQMNSKENEENAVNIVDCTPEAVGEFVIYLYNAKMRPIEDLELIFGLLNLANKYQIYVLIDGCMDRMMDIMDVDNVLKIMVVVDKFELGCNVTDMVIDFMKKNITEIVDKEDWAAFLSDFPSLVKEFILNMSKELVDAKDVNDN